MLKLDITIQHAKKLPLLGVKNEPSPYIIMECEQMSFASPIARYSQNPVWNYHTIMQAKKATSYIHFYIYNNNPNAVDELLAYAKIEFGELLTRTNTQYKLRLMNSLEENINSFLFIQHYDANPSDLYLPLGERSAVVLRLINEIPFGHYLTCLYGDSSFSLSSELSQNAFRYNPKFDRIQCVLKDQNDAHQMQTQVLIGNIGLNNCITLRFYGHRQDFVVFLATSVIINGLLPQNYNILNAKIIDITKSNGKKNTNYKLRLYGPLNQSIFNEKSECELYIQNNSQVLVEYYEDTDTIDNIEPYCSFKVPMNSLNWSNQTLECMHQLKYYDTFKSIQTTISLKFDVKKGFQLSKIIPKLNNTETSFDVDSVLLLEHIKLQNCYLFEVIKNNTVQLFHTDMRGVITSFNKFTIIDNKTEYTIVTREGLKQGGRGTLYLVSLDQQFTEKEPKNIENSLVFKISIQQPNKIEQSRIDYGSKFLSYAKKASVVNICKKFNQMVHDDLLKMKVKSKYTGISRKGIIKILNMKAFGSFGKVSVQIGVDSVYKHAFGQVGNYLMEKPYKFYVGDGSIKVKTKIEGIDAAISNNDKKRQDFQACFYGSFCDFFGTPTSNKLYSQQLKVSPAHKLQIVYTFEQGQKLAELPFKKTSDLQFFQPTNSICLRLKRAFVGVNAKQYKFRVSRGGYVYESLSYISNNNKIYFQSSENMILRVQSGQEINPIFISSYSHDEQDNFLIYNGFINVSEIVGKGQYEVILTYEKEEKKKDICFIFQVAHSCPYLSGQNSGVLKINKVSANTLTPVFKNIYKHYISTKINNYQYDIYECTLSEQSLTLNASINLRRGDTLLFQVYSSYKAISKELFNSTEKEMIACGHVIWEEIQQEGHLILNYYPKKEGQLKFTKNNLSIQEKSYKFHLSYTIQKTNIQTRIEGLKLKPAYNEIDVLNRGVVSLFLKGFYPIEMQSKIVSIQIKGLNLQLSCQSGYMINKTHLVKGENMEFQLQASITMKEGEKYKRVTSICMVKLRGKRYRINQNTSIIMHFAPYFYITGNFIIFYNKFVSIPQGDLIIRDISTRGVKIDRFDLSFKPQAVYDGKQDDKIYKKQGSEAKDCVLSLKTTSQMNSLLLSFQGKGFRTKSLICLSQLNIDRYDEQFTFEKQTLIGGQSLVITLKVSYRRMKQNKQQEMSIKYNLINSKEVVVSYNPDYYNILTTNKHQSKTPNKTQGFFIQVLIPTELADQTRQIHIISQGSEAIVLAPSVSKHNQYVFYSTKYIEAKSIKLINREYIDRPVEALGKQEGLWKFMIDQNPKLICILAQNPCSISNIGNENWTFKFNFHRLLAISKKRLLFLKNTPNDEILTKKLALLVKHGSQYHVIRNLDEFGNKKTPQHVSLQFGYDSNCNIIEAFLVVDNYFNNRKYQTFQKLSKNWMQFFPISYGVINVSNISPEIPFGFELSPLQNHSINLEKAIDHLIIRQQDIYCLCDVSFTKKSWGFITIRLKGCTALSLTDKRQGLIYIYYKIQIQDSNRNIVSGLTTQARSVGKAETINFTNNNLQILFVQDSFDSHYSLKISGFILDNSNHYSFVEKRQEITDYLQRRGKHQINIQVKANETNNICKNTFQIGLQLSNTIKQSQKGNIIQRAKSINSVDALSFRQLDNIQFFERLLGCQQLSHFNECLQEIKESFIYVQNSQYSSFIMLIEYLSFNFDTKLIGQICEIIHFNLLKCPQIISDLEDSGITKVMYEYFKLICLRERMKVPSKVAKVTNQEYMNAVAMFKQKKDVRSLKETLSLQMYVLYTPDQLLATLSGENNEAVLNIINLLLKHSKAIKENLSRQMETWIEMFGFTTKDSQLELFVLVLKNSIIYGTQLSQINLHRLVQILMQREYGLPMLFQFWQKLKDQNQKGVIYQSVLGKYQNHLQKNSVETCRGLKMMLSSIATQKNKELLERLETAHRGIIKKLLENVNKANDIVVLSSHMDLLAFLLDQRLLNEEQRMEIAGLIKSKLESLKDNNNRLILNNYSSKFNKGKAVKIVNNTRKKEGLREQMDNKAGFYKKYLITND